MLNRQKFKDLKSSDFLKSVLKLSGGTIFSQLLTILLAPIISRLYSPSQFGEFALYNSIISITIIFSTLRYDLAIVIAKTKVIADSLIKICIFLIILTFIIGTIITLIYESYFVSSGRKTNSFIFLLPINLVIVSLIQVLNYTLNRSNNFSAIAFSKILQNIVNSSITISNGIWLKHNLGLIYANILSGFFSLLYLYYKAKNSYKANFNSLNGRILKKVAYHFRDFPLFSAPTSFLDTLSISVPILFISSFFSGELTGQYSMAMRLLTIPTILIGASISQVFFKKFSDSVNSGDSKKILIRTWSILAGIGVLPCLTIFFGGEVIFLFIFGKEWVIAGKIASILAIPILFTFVSSPTSTAFIVFRIQHLSFVFGFLGIILRPLAFYLGYLYNDLFLSLKAGAVVDILLIVIYNIIILNKSNKNVKTNLPEFSS